jgi:hypothetical protein
MPSPEPETPQSLWKDQQMEERNMQMRLTPDELRAIVRSRKNLKARVHAISIVVMVAVAIAAP